MNEKPKLGEICWNELATPNVKAAKDFYGKVFGWEFFDQDIGDMNYTMIKKGSKDLGGIWAIPKDQQMQMPPHWMTYILVEKLEDSVEKVSKNGGKIMKQPSDVGDFGRFAVIADPTGAHIALWQSLKE